MSHETRSAVRKPPGLVALIACALWLAACSTPANTAIPAPTTASPAINVPATAVSPALATPFVTEPPISTPSAVTESAPTVTLSVQVVPPTPDCRNALAATPAQTEGPYYKPDTPDRTSLLQPGMNGTQLIVTGYVLTTDCQPIAGAWLDFWQADAEGQYDNTGYNLRGHQTTDASGRYSVETVIPGLYPGRTRHIHVKVQAPNGPILTTQIYFPDEPGNNSDSIFNPALTVNLQDTDAGKLAIFNFVLNVK